MKAYISLIVALTALTGCSHVYRNPSGDDTAEVGITVRIAASPFDHRTEIAVRPDPNARWATITHHDDVRVRPGVQHFRFEGKWLASSEADHHHHYYGPCIGCAAYVPGSAGDAAGLIIAGLVTAAIIASEVEAHQKDVVSTCAVEVALEVSPEDDIELTFRHDTQDRCDVLCKSYSDSGKARCRLAATHASG